MSYVSSLNASTLLAQVSLNKGTERAAVSMERLSTGLAVASAKDDPSAFYAGSTLGASIAWEAQATKNISDTSSLLNATDGAIEQVKTMLQRIRVLAMQAANATAELDRNLLQAEVDQLTSEIDRLTQTTVYNGHVCLTASRIKGIFMWAAMLEIWFPIASPDFDPTKLVRTPISVRVKMHLAPRRAVVI